MEDVSKVLVTGGAGFIGSHLVDRLMDLECHVKVVDNLSSGSLGNVERWLKSPYFEFTHGDLKVLGVARKAVEDVEVVFHLAANPDIRVGIVNPSVHFEENLLVTFNVLEAMRQCRTTHTIVFFSSSTIYGEPLKFPTPENYGPLLPISMYGASKLGCESLISAYCHIFNLHAIILRLANITGGRSKIGVIRDFIRKLTVNSKKLEVLGDGNQSKSYLHVNDLLDAALLTLDSLTREREVDTYNVGSLDQVSTRRIAEIVCEEMSLKKVDFEYTGGTDGGGGWKGDVKTMLLSNARLLELGWKPSLNSEEAVRLACQEVLQTVKKKGRASRKEIVAGGEN